MTYGTGKLIQETWVDEMLACTASQVVLESNGFGYEDYDFPEEFRTSLSLPTNFGISLADPSFTCSVIQRHPRLKLVTYKEAGWGEQDVVGCIRLE